MSKVRLGVASPEDTGSKYDVEVLSAGDGSELLVSLYAPVGDLFERVAVGAFNPLVWEDTDLDGLARWVAAHPHFDAHIVWPSDPVRFRELAARFDALKERLLQEVVDAGAVLE